MLVDLMGLKHKQSAPRSIVATVVAREKAGLEDDKRQQLWSDEAGLLAVLPLDLDSDGIGDFLVYPTHHLPTFCGAHSIACWVFKGQKDGNHRLVLSGRHDEVHILETKTNGMRDIDLVYGMIRTFYKYRYNGREYQLTGEITPAMDLQQTPERDE